MYVHIRRAFALIAAWMLIGLASPAAAQGEPSETTRTPTDATSSAAGEAPSSAELSSPSEADSPNPYRRSDIIMWTTVGLGLLHHADHVLRANHSGFPFTPRVNEFTYSLSIYPLILGGHFLDAGPNYWILVESLGFVGLGLAHTLIEPPHDQHRPWVDGSNVLGADSTVAGRSAQVVSVLLSAGVGAHLASSIVDGIQCGFTWTERETCGPNRKRPRVGVAPTSSGVKATVQWRW